MFGFVGGFMLLDFGFGDVRVVGALTSKGIVGNIGVFIGMFVLRGAESGSRDGSVFGKISAWMFFLVDLCLVMLACGTTSSW